MNNNLIVPETWNTLEEFAYWYKNNNFPFRIPNDGRVFSTDSTFSMIVFRQDVYQAELYLIRPNITVPPHSHDFESLTIFMGGNLLGNREGAPNWQIVDDLPQGTIGSKLESGKWHSFITKEKGFFMFVLQKWRGIDQMLSAGATLVYKGEPMGPEHEKALNEYKLKQ